MKDVFETLLSHRSIRKFQTTPVPVDVQEQIFNATFRTASSRAIQNTSVIRVTDQAKRDALAQVCRQPYTAQAPEFLVFIVDVARAMRILEEKGVSPEAYAAAPTMDTTARPTPMPACWPSPRWWVPRRWVWEQCCWARF